MHLTNYSINKRSENFVKNKDEDGDDVGHKRSLTATFTALEENGIDTDGLWDKIKDIIVKTIITIEPFLKHDYRSSQPNDITNSMAFQVLGFDVLVDSNAKPWLLEVNQSPSISTDAPLDLAIKYDLIYDTLHLLGLTRKSTKKFKPKPMHQQK